MKGNLGCGLDYRDGWHNVDKQAAADPDEVVDLDEYPWPWDDNVYEELLMDNVLEHLYEPYTALQEVHRVCKPGAKITIRIPHWNSPGAWANPTHRGALTHQTFTNYLVEDLFTIITINAQRVRFGRALPEFVALYLADHIGHIVSEVEVILANSDTGTPGYGD